MYLMFFNLSTNSSKIKICELIVRLTVRLRLKVYTPMTSITNNLVIIDLLVFAIKKLAFCEFMQIMNKLSVHRRLTRKVTDVQIYLTTSFQAQL